ncbi:DUF1996 domain-containing protein [Nonomuraea lactucae]|uniref:DUF1996 domain-containing protein n=1 Tax=Nonomuraea lactucae TaxID=2249762 RepID=UPI000DE26A79|nr:DUF1996 domain-containing protein [Nonomuraea lactucae]
MSSSRRLAAAFSALAVVAGGLVSAAVISVGPAIADHCEPGQGQQQQEQPERRQRGQDQQDPNGQDDQGQQNPDGQDNQNQDPNNQDQNQDNGNQNQDQNNRNQNDQNQNQDGNRNQDDGQNQNQDRNRNQDDGQRQGGDQQLSGGGTLAQDPAQDPNNQNPDNQDQQNQNPNRNNRNQDNGQQDPNNQDQNQDNGDQNQNQNNRNQNQDPDGQDAQDPDAQDPNAQNQRQRRRGGNNQSPSASPSPTNTAGEGENDCADLGPFLKDFVDIRQVQPNSLDAQQRGRGGARGSFVSRCGTNQNGHNNPDNFIVAPGVSNGAHHLHDYVGNVSTDAFSTDQSLAAAGTTCRLNDQSTYFWPVLRDRKVDDNIQDPDGNVGRVLRARSVSLEFRGNSNSRVSPMPRFLRLITGDAKAATNGGGNARAAWTCTGFTNRITTKYPLCPRSSQVVRILDFPSCWDGQNTDSANHRTHVVFPDQGGGCPQGTRAIPQLRMTLTYSVPQGPSFALDAFPEQLHNPITDHADFANVMPNRLMRFVVDCINRGRRC